MAKLYVFGIGGTGARVVKSLTMLLASGIKTKYDIVPILIDPDRAGGDLNRTVKVLREYQLIQKEIKKRLNPSASVKIGNHVWIGTNVTILKGTSVAENCTVGAASLLCKQYLNPNCVIAGVPAKEVKQDIDWMAERI